MVVQKKDLLFSWGFPIIGFPISGFLIFFGLNLMYLNTIASFLLGLFFFCIGIVGIIADILLLKDVINGKISPMFIKKSTSQSFSSGSRK